MSVAAFAHRHDEARQRLARWLKDGLLQNRETVIDGLENAPAAFIGMMVAFGGLVAMEEKPLKTNAPSAA